MKTNTIMQKTHIAAALSILLFISSPMLADVKLAILFCDHMVLQQGMSVPVWGTAGPGEQVVVSLGQHKQTTTAGPDGKWMVRLADVETGGPFEMTVTGRNTLTVKDIYVGEVWLCSGQSNMDMTVAREDRYWCGVQNEAEEVAATKYSLIREFKVRLKMTDTPQTDVEGQWVVCSPQTVGRFSATAYFFARELHKKLNVPVGLVTSSYGASTAEAWTSRTALEARPELVFLLDAYAQKKKEYDPNGAAAQKYRAAMEQWEKAAAQAKAEGKDRPKEPKNPNPKQDQHNPCVLYNGMIAPLAPYAIRGVIWYQGESSGPTADKYFNLMETLIQNWRQMWGQGDFPFLFVQLANNGKLATQPDGSGWMARVREGQLKTLTVPNTAMAVAIDIGDANNIHPKNKQEIGLRLALAARALAYHESIPYSGPIYDSMTIEGSAVRLRFKHTDGGLVAKGEKLVGFGIAGEDSNFVWADAKIDGDTIVVSSLQVAKPIAVRYGWADNPPVNLYNKAGLPASPFRTDGAVTSPATLDMQKGKK
jgi:sialate O-acetylesterase